MTVMGEEDVTEQWRGTWEGCWWVGEKLLSPVDNGVMRGKDVDGHW